MKAKNMPYEGRMEILKTKKLCYRCFGEHMVRACKVNNIKCAICERNHHTLLCRDFLLKRALPRIEDTSNKRARFERTSASPNPLVTASTISSANIGRSSKVALKTLKVKVTAGGKEEVVRAFIDEGCERSYLLSATAKNLDLRPVGRMEAVHLLWGGHETAVIYHNQYEVKLKSTTGDFQLKATVRDQSPICGKLINAQTRYPSIEQELLEKNVRLSDVDHGEQEIGLLIGADLYPHILTATFIKLRSGPVAIRTKLGWTLMGEISEENISTTSLRGSGKGVVSMSTIDNNVTKFWDLELMGIKEPVEESAIKKKVEMAREDYI
jgi:hypothetical protein